MSYYECLNSIGDSRIHHNFSNNCEDDSWFGAFLAGLQSVLQIPMTNDYIITIYYVPCNNCYSEDSQNSIMSSLSKSNFFTVYDSNVNWPKLTAG